MKMQIKSKKFSVLATSIMLTAFLVAPAYAEHACGHEHRDHSKQVEMYEKHKSELHDKLHLTKDQETAWNTFSEKMKPNEHREHQSWSEFSKLSTPDRLDKILALKQDHLKRMEDHIRVIKEFYAQLTSDQKKIFDDSFHHHDSKWNHHFEHKGQ